MEIIMHNLLERLSPHSGKLEAPFPLYGVLRGAVVRAKKPCSLVELDNSTEEDVFLLSLSV